MGFDVVEKIVELDERVAALETAMGKTAPPAGAGEVIRSAGGLYLGPGFSERLHQELTRAGYLTMDDLRAASDAELRRVPGVGPATLAKIRAAVG